jgi:hypothetical protein
MPPEIAPTSRLEAQYCVTGAPLWTAMAPSPCPCYRFEQVPVTRQRENLPEGPRERRPRKPFEFDKQSRWSREI